VCSSVNRKKRGVRCRDMKKTEVECLKVEMVTDETCEQSTVNLETDSHN
jgi:hypothetical protein